MSKARCIMVQGTMSGAGKSLLCAALCRIFAQDGYRTAPFKSQNMALNSFVTRDGLEMGRAQVVQAQAAGVEPDVRMNPILLKPSSDIGSQVIVNGEVRGDMPAKEYFRRKKALIPDILRAYDGLASEFDIIVIEGAGSPAEINLKADDIVNMGLARLVAAPVLLAGDIDRGGVFAQLYGTVELLEPDERARICGLIINKFRGDVEILRPGLAMLEEKTRLPVVGVVPYLKVDIEDEDSLSERLQQKNAVKPLDVAIVRLPHISNFTDFMPLEQHPLLGVRYVQAARELGMPDLIILPGTKNTVNDLLWLRQCGLETAVQKLAWRGTPVLGVCGGYQMLGGMLDDSAGTESGRPQTLRGLELLPTRTVFTLEKRRAQVTATAAAPFAGAALTGYEIHTGRTTVEGAPFCTLADGTPDGCVQGSVFGTYLHGLFDSGELTEKLAALLCRRKGLAPETAAPLTMQAYREQQFDLLADGVRRALDMSAIYAAMGLAAPKEERL
ncbi:MAG: cobyric acid synthase [Subdoligranulum variabile]|nr:cobyric acid synthase [Subdoligranulum variabile]